MYYYLHYFILLYVCDIGEFLPTMKSDLFFVFPSSYEKFSHQTALELWKLVNKQFCSKKYMNKSGFILYFGNKNVEVLKRKIRFFQKCFQNYTHMQNQLHNF